MGWLILDAIAPAEARAVLAAARRRKFKRGDTIFHEGDPGDTLHLVDKGRVALRITTPLGDVATLRIIGPGDHFGELAVVSPAPRNATAVCVDAVETLSLRREQVDELRKEHPSIDKVLMEAMIAELRRLSAQVTELLYVPVPKRLARRLCELSDQFRNGSQHVEVPLTQDDLAGLVGTTRPTINKCLQEFGPMVALSRGKVTVLDEAGLAKKGR